MRTLLLIALFAVACGKDGASTSDAVLVAWKKGGLEPSTLTKTQTDVGTDCAAGTVNKIDVLVCTFKSDKEAKQAEDAGLKWVGDHTGASKSQGPLLIVVADRKKVDPNGKVINQIITLPAN